jgi:hypothetical protein
MSIIYHIDMIRILNQHIYYTYQPIVIKTQCFDIY